MRRLFALVVLIALAAVSATVLGDSRPPYVVIVNPANATTSVGRQFAADAFLKKVTTWPSGDVIHPVDLVPGSAARRQFTEDVLHRSIQEVKVYWQQRIFSGRDVPPPELDSDEDVVRYVLKHDGAIGYVSGGAQLGGAKPIAVR